ncbi:MAG: hypothetical protein ISR76_00290 [Planctomycetes bacterium]|nr:hypothetical protein [Planctomycetota bacterium]MBL7007409.1 hypothetical protein [Planctomycetota bacterium]
MRTPLPILCSLLLAAGGLAAPAGAQATQSWWTTYNGPPGDQNDSSDLAGFDPSGNPISVGFSLGFSGALVTSDIVVLKHDPAGNLLWQARWDGGAQDQPHDAYFAADGSVYVCGEADSFTGPMDFIVLKVDAAGSIAWSLRWGGPGGLGGRAYGVTVDAAGRVLVTGETYASGTAATRATTIQLDPLGNLLWDRHYAGPASGSDTGFDVAVDAAGAAYVACASAGAASGVDWALLKYSPAGNLDWERRYDGPASYHDVPYRVLLDPAGNPVVGGHVSGSAPAWSDLAARKYDPLGNLVWSASFDGPHSGGDTFGEMVMDGAGAFYLSGLGSSAGWDLDMVLGKIGPAGGVAWVTSWDGGGSDDYAVGLAAGANGRVYVAGAAYSSTTYASDAVALAYDAATGAPSWQDVWNGPGNDDDGYFGVAVDSSGAVLFTGDSYSPGTRYDLLTTLYDDQAGFRLEVDPLIRGALSELRLSGALPGEMFRLGYSLAGTGAGPCFGALGGLCLDLLNPVTHFADLPADASGSVTTRVPVPPNAPRVPVHFQAVLARGANSLKSNVATQTIQ